MKIGHLKITRKQLASMGWENARKNNGRIVSAIVAAFCWKTGPLRVTLEGKRAAKCPAHPGFARWQPGQPCTCGIARPGVPANYG